MSLIPSDSQSFPDHFIWEINHLRRPVKPAMPALERAPARQEDLPQPPAKTPSGNGMPAVPVAKSETADLSDQEKPHRILVPSAVPATLKRKVRWNTRAASTELAPTTNEELVDVQKTNEARPSCDPTLAPPKSQPNIRLNVRAPLTPTIHRETPRIEGDQPKAVLPPPASPRIVEAPSAELVQTLLARSLFASPDSAEMVASPKKNGRDSSCGGDRSPMNGCFTSSAAEFVSLVSDGQQRLEERPYSQPKLRRFLLCESAATGILAGLATLSLFKLFQNPTVVFLINLTTVIVAVAATVIPILFFAIVPSFRRSDQ